MTTQFATCLELLPQGCIDNECIIECNGECAIECICECPIHKLEALDIKILKKLSNNDNINMRKLDVDIVENLDIEKLGDDMKKYENEFETRVPGECAFIVRADGHSFSKFTKGFHQPFDENFKEAMILTMNDCLNEFNAVTGYTHSDEITLIFAPMSKLSKKLKDGTEIMEQQSHMFNGRICKILTLISSYISIRFNYNLMNLINKNQKKYSLHDNELKYSDEFIYKLNNVKNAYFDSRILVFPSPEQHVDIARHMIWRSLRDCPRNCISTYARQYYSTKELNGKNSKEMIEMMAKKEFDYNKQVPMNEKFGTYGKKTLYQIESIDQKTNQLIMTTRGTIINKCLRANTSQEFIQLLLNKYFENSIEEERVKQYANYLNDSTKDINKYQAIEWTELEITNDIKKQINQMSELLMKSNNPQKVLFEFYSQRGDYEILFSWIKKLAENPMFAINTEIPIKMYK